ncbi:MAG: amidohydrolase [Microscillaceae bacterium]|nr:amidohydrolase [Microscillaceae bacterium]
MKETLALGLIQTPLHWHQPEANRAMLEEKIWQLPPNLDVIVLPEMFTTGFTMDAPRLAEPMNLHTFKWMKQMAAQTGAALTGSYIVAENGAYFNRLLWMQPDGSFWQYDKRHLFRMAEEHHTYTPGQHRLVITWKGWRICPLICYDLRFPVWSRNQGLAYDLLLYVANWPQARQMAWEALLPARAIENLSYALGLNRVGEDGKGIAYAGGTAAYDFKGQALAHLGAEEKITTLSLEAGMLHQYREKFPAHLDADAFDWV